MYVQIDELLAAVIEFTFGSQIIMQAWNKILVAHDVSWKVLRSNVRHRFGSIIFPITDIISHFRLIYEFVAEYETCNRVYATFKSKQASYVKQVQQLKHQTSRPSKQSVSKPTPAKEVERLLAKNKPQPPIKPIFATIYENIILNESTPFKLAVVGDFVDIMRTFGQSMASDDKIYCSELVFVEEAETDLDAYSVQTIKQPFSPRLKSIVRKMKMFRV